MNYIRTTGEFLMKDIPKLFGKRAGCPCGMNGGCCDKPNVQTVEHDCFEKVCEGCYELECNNCGDSCSHEL